MLTRQTCVHRVCIRNLVCRRGIPMYVCATGSIPIAVALMLKGLTPGAALVFLMAGPACNLASVLVVRKVLGTRTMVLYLLSIITGAIIFGSLLAKPRYFAPETPFLKEKRKFADGRTNMSGK